jgi:uncharacterized RmlC-like cupin family protein
VRLAAIAPESARNTRLWGGLFEVKPRAHTGIHHHGEQQTIAYVLEGVCEVRWGAHGEYVAEASAGDFIHVPAYLPHMEINPSESQPFRWVVVRSTPTPIVVNLPDDTWPQERVGPLWRRPRSERGARGFLPRGRQYGCVRTIPQSRFRPL